MKIVNVQAGKVALTFRKGNLKKVLSEGTHWVSLFDEVKVYAKSKPFKAPIELNILLRNHTLANQLIIVDVQDNEIALKFEDGQFKEVLTPGKYAFWEGLIEYTFTKIDLNKPEITEDVSPALLKKVELGAYLSKFIIPQNHQGLLYYDGKLQGILETGKYQFWRGVVDVSMIPVSLQTQQLEISGQEMLSKDKAAIRMNFIVQYKITDILKALAENQAYGKQLYAIMQLALREYVSAITLDELLDNKNEMGKKIQEITTESVASLGVAIKSCGVRDIILPGEMKEIMNQVLMAQKKAQANTITRREETASTRSLLNTAKLMEENEMLFKLKEMEYVEKIAEKINSISLSGNSQVVDQLRTIFGS